MMHSACNFILMQLPSYVSWNFPEKASLHQLMSGAWKAWARTMKRKLWAVNRGGSAFPSGGVCGNTMYGTALLPQMLLPEVGRRMPQTLQRNWNATPESIDRTGRCTSICTRERRMRTERCCEETFRMLSMQIFQDHSLRILNFEFKTTYDCYILVYQWCCKVMLALQSGLRCSISLHCLWLTVFNLQLRLRLCLLS